MSDLRVAVVRPLSRSHRPAGIWVTKNANAPRHPEASPVPGLEGLFPGRRGSTDPALVVVGPAFLRLRNSLVVCGVGRVHDQRREHPGKFAGMSGEGLRHLPGFCKLHNRLEVVPVADVGAGFNHEQPINSLRFDLHQRPGPDTVVQE